MSYVYRQIEGCVETRYKAVKPLFLRSWSVQQLVVAAMTGKGQQVNQVT